MAGFYIETKRRPCYVGERRAMFNCWSQERQGVLGIVEFEDGSVAKVYPGKIHFADGGRFEEHVFLPKEHLSKNQEAN